MQMTEIYYRSGSDISIFSHDNILEEMKLISLEMAILVWKPSGGHLQLHKKDLFFELVCQTYLLHFIVWKTFHKIGFCKDLRAIKPSVHQDCFS